MQPALGVHRLTGEAPPDLGHALDPVPGGISGEGGTVHRAHRRAVDAIGHEAVLGEDLEHPDLDGAAGPAPGQHQGGDRARLVGVLVVLLIGQPPIPGRRGALQGEAEDQHHQHHGDHDEHGEDDGEGGVGRRGNH